METTQVVELSGQMADTEFARWSNGFKTFILPWKSAPRVRLMPKPVDILAQCPKCKTVETIQVSGSTLLRCRRFFQVDGKVYHDCGSTLPCSLHR